MKKWLISTITGVIAIGIFLYYDHGYKNTLEYLEINDIPADVIRFSPPAEIIYYILLLGTFIISILSLVKEKGKLGLIGLVLFLLNVSLHFF